MKNADMPAMPLEVVDETQSSRWWSGLTKREMMAMHAPEVPDWFSFKWRDENKSNGMFFIPLHDGRSRLVEITATGSAAMYFAWRTTYADALLAELERTCHKT
jgi:hypothetical protein